MNKYIVDATTGTVVDISNCFIVDPEDLGDRDLSDDEISELAKEKGISVVEMARDTGFGDNKYRYTVSYSPLSIKDEADMLIEGGVYDETDGAVFEALMWAKDASPEELVEVAESIMAYDSVWDGFRDSLVEAVTFSYKGAQQ